MTTDRRTTSAAQDRDVRVIRRALDALRGLDIYQLRKGDALAADAALARIDQRLRRSVLSGDWTTPDPPLTDEDYRRAASDMPEKLP